MVFLPFSAFFSFVCYTLSDGAVVASLAKLSIKNTIAARQSKFAVGFITALILCVKVVESAASFPESEYLALYDLFNATHGDSWRWSQQPEDGNHWDFFTKANPCTDHWQGVNCMLSNHPPDLTYHVSSLNLEGMNLRGQLPGSLYNLTKLEYLQLSGNFLQGTIPISVGFLADLQSLKISKSALTGQIPNSLCNLAKLHELDLLGNHLNGTIPDDIGNLSILSDLYLNNNELIGTIPRSIGYLTKLKQLFLGTKQLADPECAIALYPLRLKDNKLNGTIPDTICRATALEKLLLDKNALSGTIPVCIGNLTNMKELTLNNNLLSGSIPSSTGNLTHLEYLYLHDNLLSGSIPCSLSKLSALQKIFIEANNLTESVPSCIGNLTNLHFLSLGFNKFTGTIPTSLGNLTHLQYVDFSNNKMVGQISMLGSVKNLVAVFLQENKFTGPLTTVFTGQHRLQTVQLDNNQFTGELPSELFTLPSLRSLSIVSSCLHGTLPGNICNATQVEALVLYGLTNGKSCRAQGVQSLSGERFHGPFPTCLLRLSHLKTLLLSSNGLTGSFAGADFVGKQLVRVDLSHNHLTGAIPDILQYHSWELLDLSHNRIHGTLQADILHLSDPSSAGAFFRDPNVSVTEQPNLSLTSNRLSGPVPSSLGFLQGNLSVLAGNLFECRYDKSNLPQHDSDVRNYQCASNSFYIASYVWLGIGVCAIVFLLTGFLWRKKAFFAHFTLVQLPDVNSDKLKRLYAVLKEFHTLSVSAWYCAAFCLVVLLPYYAIVSNYEGTHTYQYAYVLSAIYTSGVLPFVLDVLLLVVLLLIILALVYKLSGKYVDNAYFAVQNQDRWQRAKVWILFILANVSVVLGTNIAFIYVVLYKSSRIQTLVQVLLSLFKLSWSMFASPKMIRELDAYFLPQTEGPPEPFFTLQLLVALFNNIAIPCLVVAAIDPNCFSNILLPPDSQTVTYLLPTCGAFVSSAGQCIITSLEPTSLQFTPPFTYSYQCSASFITSYAPTFIYMSISTVFLSPLLQFVLLILHEHLHAGSIAHHMVSYALPQILKPPTADLNAAVDYSLAPIFGAVGILVTLLTQLGILLTFGAIFPPVALGMAVSITAVVLVTRYKAQRFVRAVEEKQLFSYLDIINAECERVGTREQMQVAVKILICYCCAFYTLFLFDTLGDAVGFDASVWILLVFPLLPFAVYGSAVLFMMSFAPMKIQKSSTNVRRSRRTEQGGDLELRASSINADKVNKTEREGASNDGVSITLNALYANSSV